MGESKAKRIGSVPYLNSAPLTFGIEGETEFLPPSSLAKRLRAEGMDVGMRASITQVKSSQVKKPCGRPALARYHTYPIL